ncbi:O-antigen polymerase [Mycolicibacterium sp. XJ1904]
MRETGEAGQKWWFSPPFLILLPVVMSFAAWLALNYQRAATHAPAASWEKLAGFDHPEPAGLHSVALLVLWYGAITSASLIGWELASRRRLSPRLIAQTSTKPFERAYFFVILAMAALGVVYAYYKIGSTYSIVTSLANQTANDFSNALPGFAGPQTLRYATILAAPIALHLFRQKALGWPYVVIAGLLLFLNAMITSRLGLMMAVFVYLALWLRAGNVPRGRDKRRTRGPLLVAAIVVMLFGLLTVLNYSRNANYYRDLGVNHPIAMNMYQMGAYLAVPAQVSLGVADALTRGVWKNEVGLVEATDAVRPTFLQFDKTSKDEGRGEIFYGHNASFSESFITNSVFADTYASYGVWGNFYTLGLYGLAGYLFGWLMRFSGVIAGSAGVMAYSFAEVWRTQMLNNGIVIFLILLTAGSAVLALEFARRRARQPGRVRQQVVTRRVIDAV